MPDRRRQPHAYPLDGVELSDEDLEVVVGGLSPEASAAYAAYLSEAAQRSDPVARLQRLRTSGIWRSLGD